MTLVARAPRSQNARMRIHLPLYATVLLVLGCNAAPTATSEANPPTTATPAPAGAAVTAVTAAMVGKPAPDFTLKDYDGKSYKLSDLRGKTVVLEWFNPGCPFVKASHTKGSLKDTAKRDVAKGVVWLAINSAAPGKQGHDASDVATGRKAFDMENPILADEAGQVGRLYGATNTPHMFVIDPQGTLVYRGAIDNSPDGEGESPTGGKLINYVDAALDDITAGHPVQTKETKAYGCSVKYGS
jgi:peroxiredoxin